MMWKYSQGNRRKVVIYLLMSTMSEIINTFWAPIVMATILNIVGGEGITDSSIKKLFLLSLLLPLGSTLSWIFHGPARCLEEANAFLARVNYRGNQLQGVMNMPLEWHNEHHTGNTIDKIEKGALSIYDFSSETFQFVKPIVKLIGCFSAIVYFSGVSAFIVIAIMLIAISITVKIDSICGSMIRELSRQENKLSESVHDAINNISTVITLRVEKLVYDSILKKMILPFEIFKRNARLNETKWYLTSLCCSIMTVLVYWMYFFQNKDTAVKVTVGSFFLVVSYLDKISELAFNFTNLYGWTIRRMYRLLNGDELSLDFKQTSFSNHLLPTSWKKLRVENLCFSYGKSEGDPHLDDISFELDRGKKIAVVGSSGSGKSTLLNVVRDIYHPQKGNLFVDEVPIPTGFDGVSRAISLVQQEPQIFERSIRENITLGTDCSDELIRLYADIACFSEVIDSLPKGLDSMVKERGVNLSGGEVQRLALTRGLLASHDKDIVLLDEPTSSLDMANTMTVFQNILRQFHDKTVISSIHTLQVLSLFDQVYMFDKGKIIGIGTVNLLQQTCPEFAELWQKQYVDVV